jgi:hypothetical protein
MLVACLIVLNIPVYIFIGWLAFDSKGKAADTFFETIVAVLKRVFVPSYVRVMLGMDTDDSWGIFPIAGFFLACAGIVYGEYCLIEKFF